MPALSPAAEISQLREQNVLLLEANAKLQDTVAELKRQLDWFKRQLFGQKSEKRLLIDPAVQMSLLEGLVPTTDSVQIPSQTIPAHERQRKSRDGCVTEQGLRFDDRVPVQVVDITPPELQGEQADAYEIVRYEETHLLAQRPGSYVVIRERRPVLKHKPTQQMINTPAPARVLEGSLADVSFLVGLLIDKFCYHLPLYRQHQRLQDAGITLSRGTLTQLVQRAIALLVPIAEAQFRHVLQSRILAMDETPIKAGQQEKGKMHQGYFWPLYGEDHEVCFRYHHSRALKHVQTMLEGFEGTLLTDGYVAYASYVANKPKITHAQCWSHNRRGFENSLDTESEAADEALQIIGALYQIEEQIRDKALTGEAKLVYRQKHSEPVVKTFWLWCEQQCQRHDLSPSNPLAKALNYARSRTRELQVFLSDPDVPLDTNHLERALRAIPMGKKNWLFCWTEAGAEAVATIQSLLVTCRLLGVDPYTYLVDVLQRVDRHPNSQIIDLTPRVWKEKFAANPLRSVIDL